MSSNQRIFIICDIWLDGRDAQTTHILEVFNNLSKFNNAYLFAPRLKKPSNMAQNIIFVPTIEISVFKYGFYQLFLFFYLIYYCFKLSPDVIYTRLSMLTFSSFLISKIFKIPSVIEINGLMIDEMNISNSPRLYIKIAKLSEKLNYKQASKIVAVTQGVKEGIKRLYDIRDEKILVIENGANTDLFKPIDQNKAKAELKLEETKNYICFVGSLPPWQGVEYLIQASPLILAVSPSTRFLIVGDGAMKKELVNLADKTGVSDKFIFTGTIPYAEVPKYINASDICVAPFIRGRNERIGLSPLKIYEYASCGKPILASRILNLGFIELQNIGILTEPENPEELGDAIIKLLKDRKLREEMGKNGREYVIKNHSWESVAERVAEVCKRAIEQHKKGER